MRVLPGGDTLCVKLSLSLLVDDYHLSSASTNVLLLKDMVIDAVRILILRGRQYVGRL
ncbi:unnamed protein product [Cylicocyclus nassatus]|uniref:Uncharacterized protein n=1 Tax=Cylicocyclus nassatus TaxID=53992 RepID=A0AA36HBW3_CYLNA|nr:unnamed protein product [Cylicocyclus nassatus]